MKRTITKSAKETKKLAASLAKKLLKKQLKKTALISALTGDLGSGKTTFVQGFLRALGIRGPITSPTFVLIKKYKLRADSRSASRSFAYVFHIDAYRIKKPRELLSLGFKEIIKNPQNIVLIEWAEKIKRVLPKNTIWFKFEHSEKKNLRSIQINS